MTSAALDPLEITRALIRCPSVTPVDAGALDALQTPLEGLGFACHRVTFEEPGSEPVENLFARLGQDGERFGFAGHTDVVPVGDPADWSHDPFAAAITNGRLYGRGAVDMKGSIGAFVAALARFLGRRGASFGGSICLLITGDEEGLGINGTRKLLKWMAERGEGLDACLVGEPTSGGQIGDTIKIGRRGSMSAGITIRGIQGHTAYPQHADNPAHRLVDLLHVLTNEALDEGNAHFEPSRLQVTTIDIGNAASNVIPAQAEARLNIRFNDAHSGAELEGWLRDKLERSGADYDLNVRISGESFLTPPGRLSDVLVTAVRGVTGIEPDLGTGGGTSDARFIKDYCPVAELGLRNESAHRVDEHVELEEIATLSAIYEAVLDGFFES